MEEARGGCHSLLTDKRQTLEDWSLLGQVPTSPTAWKALAHSIQDGVPGAPPWAQLRWLLHTLNSPDNAGRGLEMLWNLRT